MSRHINGISHLSKEHEIYQNNPAEKLVITRKQNILYGFLFKNGRIIKIIREEDALPIGTILVGKVVNVLNHMEGAFVRLDKKNTMAYLPLTDKERTFIRVLNRKADGCIRQNDDIIVQIVKEPQKSKPYLVSGILELKSSLFLLSDGIGQVKISRKIEGMKIKELEEFGNKNISPNRNILIRSHAIDATEETLQGQLIDLLSQFENIDSYGQNRTIYSILYQPDIFYIELIRNNFFSNEIEIVSDCPDVIEHVSAQGFACRFYSDSSISLSKVYALDTKIIELLSKKVYLKSGAYFIIEQTEALISIDVNSGKAQKNLCHEAYVLQINLEAAKEIAYQLMVRNLSGMILIDFINMKDSNSRKKLIETLCQEIEKDFVTTKFIDFTKLGLVEMTRKKVEKPLPFVLRDWKNC